MGNIEPIVILGVIPKTEVDEMGIFSRIHLKSAFLTYPSAHSFTQRFVLGLRSFPGGHGFMDYTISLHSFM